MYSEHKIIEELWETHFIEEKTEKKGENCAHRHNTKRRLELSCQTSMFSFCCFPVAETGFIK